MAAAAAVPVNIPGYTVIAPLCYQGKAGCQSALCTHMFVDGVMAESCIGYHCSYCDEPCSSQGHRCPASVAFIEAAERIHAEETA